MIPRPTMEAAFQSRSHRNLHQNSIQNRECDGFQSQFVHSNPTEALTHRGIGVTHRDIEDGRPAKLRRLLERPNKEDWPIDELMTLPEAAALYWPQGPVTTATLRTLIRKGQLRVAVLGRRHLTSRKALEDMQQEEVRLRGPAA